MCRIYVHNTGTAAWYSLTWRCANLTGEMLDNGGCDIRLNFRKARVLSPEGELARQAELRLLPVIAREPEVVGMVARRQVDCRLEVVGVPRHDDIREQGEGTRDGAQLFRRAAVFRCDHAVMNGALKTMDRHVSSWRIAPLDQPGRHASSL